MEEDKGFIEMIQYKVRQLGEWVKPDPADKPLVRVLKLFYKSIVVLVLIALSPVLLVIMLFVFFAAF